MQKKRFLTDLLIHNLFTRVWILAT